MKQCKENAAKRNGAKWMLMWKIPRESKWLIVRQGYGAEIWSKEQS